MMIPRGARGVIALLGRAPADDFQTYFGEPRAAFQNSLAAIGGSVLLFLILARNVAALRQSLAAQEGIDLGNGFPAFQIGFTFFIYLLAFTLTAFMLSLIFEKRARFYRWACLRHWMVFLALIPLTVLIVLAGVGLIPIMIANFAAFTVYIGWLFADIRLAYKLGDMGLIGSVFAACIVHALGLLIIFSAVVQLMS